MKLSHSIFPSDPLIRMSFGISDANHRSDKHFLIKSAPSDSTLLYFFTRSFTLELISIKAASIESAYSSPANLSFATL